MRLSCRRKFFYNLRFTRFFICLVNQFYIIPCRLVCTNLLSSTNQISLYGFFLRISSISSSFLFWKSCPNNEKISFSFAKRARRKSFPFSLLHIAKFIMILAEIMFTAFHKTSLFLSVTISLLIFPFSVKRIWYSLFLLNYICSSTLYLVL